jgi:hypothetical protein
VKPHRGEARAFLDLIIAVLFAAFIALAAWLALKGN